MDAHDLQSGPASRSRRGTATVALSVLVLLTVWGLWDGYGALLTGGHVH
jgi:hypothetical protein